MHALFDALSEKLRRKRARANIHVVGGSALALAYTRERITRDMPMRSEHKRSHRQAIKRSRFQAKHRRHSGAWPVRVAITRSYISIR